MAELDFLDEALDPKNPESRGFLRGFVSEYKENTFRFKSPEAKEFMKYFVASLMLEFKAAYPNTDIDMPFRIKSDKSTLEKILKFFKDPKMYRNYMETYSGKKEFVRRLRDDIPDAFAMKLIVTRPIERTFSYDPKIKFLLDERAQNEAYLRRFQRFGGKLFVKEFQGREGKKYNFETTNVSKEEYYMNNILLILRIKKLLDPAATDLLKKYDEILEKIKQNVPSEFYEAMMSKISEYNNYLKTCEYREMDFSTSVRTFYDGLSAYLDKLDYDGKDEMTNKIESKDVEIVDFRKLETDFVRRKTNKLDLALLTEEAKAIFTSSELLKQFGIELVDEPLKQKRTKNGYYANFLFIKTPFGRAEVQLITADEEIRANSGYSAHGNYKLETEGLPDIPEIDDEEGIRNYQKKVGLITPEMFNAEFDTKGKDIVTIETLGTFKSFKALMTQVEKGSEVARKREEYFSRLNKELDIYLPYTYFEEKTESITIDDIESYLESEKYEKVAKEFGIVPRDQSGVVLHYSKDKKTIVPRKDGNKGLEER